MMKQLLRDFWYDEDGLGTVEIVLIIVVLIGLAIIFKDKITTFVETILGNITGEQGNWGFTRQANPKTTN